MGRKEITFKETHVAIILSLMSNFNCGGMSRQIKKKKKKKENTLLFESYLLYTWKLNFTNSVQVFLLFVLLYHYFLNKKIIVPWSAYSQFNNTC